MTYVVVTGARKAFDLEYLGDFEEAADVLLLDAHLALVHELQHRRQVAIVDILEDDDRVLARVSLQTTCIIYAYTYACVRECRRKNGITRELA